MSDLICLPVIFLGYFTAYIVSVYALAVYIDPEDVQKLYPSMSARRRRFLERLAGDPLAFVQISAIYKSFSLIAVTICSDHLLRSLALSQSLNAAATRIIGLVVMWLLFIVFVEYMPRRSARKAITTRLLRQLWLVTLIYRLFAPIVGAYRRALRSIRPRRQISEEDKEDIIERAIETLAEQAGIGETIIEEDKKEMIGQIFQLDQTIVKEIMIPRIDVVGIEKSMAFAAIRDLVKRDGHSRYPVYDESIDKIMGLIYVKDLFNNLPGPGEEFELTAHLRKPYFVPETKVIGELLREFKTKRMHIAVVLDEYGGMAGIVTLEDIIEEIFGEIQDEHDWEQAEITRLPDGSYKVSANLLVEELQDYLDTDYEQSDYDTVGGLIYDLVGSVPREGRRIKWYDLEFEIERVEGQRIVSVKVHK